MSLALLRAAAIATGALLVALPVGAWAQGGLPSDAAAAQRTAQRSYDRALQRLKADIVAADAAIRNCNYPAYERAATAYSNDFDLTARYRGAGAKGAVGGDLPGLPKYPENCTPPPGPPKSALYFPSPVHIIPRAQPFVGFNIGAGFQNTLHRSAVQHQRQWRDRRWICGLSFADPKHQRAAWCPRRRGGWQHQR
jgi:hypothetical protein